MTLTLLVDVAMNDGITALMTAALREGATGWWGDRGGKTEQEAWMRSETEDVTENVTQT